MGADMQKSHRTNHRARKPASKRSHGKKPHARHAAARTHDTHEVHVDPRRLGAWLGLAVGDALGAAVEFLSPAEIQSRFGLITDMIPSFRWELGEWTDDTALTLAAAHAYHDGHFDLERAAQAMVDWRAQGPKDIGVLTNVALDLLARGDADALTGGYAALALHPNSAGNGSLMRALPTGLVRAPDDPRLVEESRLLSTVTHADPRCVAACIGFNAVVSMLLHRGPDVPAALAHARDLTAPFSEEVSRLIDGVLHVEAPSYVDDDGIGFVLLCLERGLMALRDAVSFEGALVDVVNCGGDADTNAAVAGALLGARFGVEAIPERWLKPLRARHELEHAVAALVGSAGPVWHDHSAPQRDDDEDFAHFAMPVGDHTTPMHTSGVTAQLLSLSFVRDAHFRLVLRLERPASSEAVVTALFDAATSHLIPEGALAESFVRYRETSDPLELAEPAREEWFACHLVERWAHRLSLSEALSPVSVIDRAE